MKASELIETLEQLPPDAEVVVARDPEGNGFDSLYAVEFSYLDDEGCPIHPDDEGEYDLDDVPRAIVLWP